MRIISMLFVLVFLSTQVFAGKITGKVTDEKSGEAIIGAIVTVKNTDKGAATDVDGNFVIEIGAGTYVLQVKYLGYTTKEVEGIVVGANQATVANVAIEESSSQTLGEVVVRSTLKKENINALYSIQKNSATISDGISADIIKKTPDRNTGDVLKRVSGTTIQDNKFVIVRGLSDRYNIALVDNAILPSTEPNRKAFSFDIIPSAMVDNIIITKAATPDLPGDFAGGVINILTKEAPDVNYNSISIGSGYNTTSTGKEFKSGYRTSTDFLGFDNGARQLPSSFPSGKQIYGGLTQAQNNAALNSLNNDFGIRTHKALPAINFQGALGRTYAMKEGNKLGITAALTYNHYELIEKNYIRQYDGFIDTNNKYKYSTNLGGLLNAAYYFGKSKIVFKNLYNRTFDDNFLYRQGHNNNSGADVRYYAYDLIQKSLFKTSLEGEHQLGKGQSKFGWLMSYNIITNNQPDQRKVSYSRQDGAENFYADNTSIGKSNSRLFSDLNEKMLNGSVYYSMPYKLFDKSNLKVGGMLVNRNRDFTNRYIGTVATTDPNLQDLVDNVRQRPVDQLYTKDVISQGVYDLETISNAGDHYTATANTIAGYVMSDNKVSDKFRVVWGARYESFHLHLLPSEAATVDHTWNDLMPSANMTYSLTEKTNLRASYFRSVARPEMRESAPLSVYDYELNANLNGDPTGKLTRSRIDNIDLRYEVYPNAGEIFSVSVFYKHFDNTIENLVNGQSSNFDITITNYKNARNIGAELELRKNLGFIADNNIFKNLNFYVNLTYVNSKVLLTSLDSANHYLNGHYITSRPLSGQSPYVINSSLTYTALDGKLSMNLLYNRVGQRLAYVGQGRLGNIYESARNLLDFQASYAISKRSEIKISAKDILNNNVRLYFDQNNNGKFDRPTIINNGTAIDDTNNKDWIYKQYKPGSTFSFTYTYRF